MIRFQTGQRVPIRKAKRKKWKLTRTDRRLNSLSKTMSEAISVDFISGIKKFKSKIDPEKIYQAWLSGNFNKVHEIIPWSQLPEDLSGIKDSVANTLWRSSAITRQDMPAPINKRLRWDLKNPALRQYLHTRTGNLIVNVEEQTKKFIAEATAKHFSDAMSPRRIARIIKPAIGLYPQQVTALNNFRIALEKKNTPEKVLEKMSASYEDRLLNYRAQMIARTETRAATNYGQLSVWQEAADQGLIDKQSAMKQWVTVPDACDDCVELEDQGPIALDDLWQTDDGALEAPPLHPHCFCMLTMVFGEAE